MTSSRSLRRARLHTRPAPRHHGARCSESPTTRLAILSFPDGDNPPNALELHLSPGSKVNGKAAPASEPAAAKLTEGTGSTNSLLG